jgi:hypothetical protein
LIDGEGEARIMLDKRSNGWRESPSTTYDADEVNRIVRRALKLERSEAVSHADLLETAAELGIDSQSLEAAIRKERSSFKTAAAHKARLQRKRDKFKSHLWSYIIVISFLFLINAMTPGSWWFQWTMLGWGIGLAFHCRSALFSER